MSFPINNGIPEADLPVKNPSGAALVRYVENGKSYSSAMPDVIAASALVQDAIDGVVSDAESQIGELVRDAQAEIDAIISGLGYLPPVEFGSGILVDSGRVTVEYNGDVYAPVLSEVPFTTAGIFDPDQWRVIQGVTASDLASVDEGKGAAMVRYDADETVAQRLDALGNLRADLSEGSGSALLGVTQAGLNAAKRTQQERNRDLFSVMDFIGYNLSDSEAFELRQRIVARTSTASDKANIRLGVIAAIAAAAARGGVSVYLPSGKYWFDDIDVSLMHGLTIRGDGPVATQIVTDSPSLDVFKVVGDTKNQSFIDFSITASVTRTGGSYFNLAFSRRALISHVELTKWFNAISFPSYEHCTVIESYIYDPSGPGDAIIVSVPAPTVEGANLSLINLFIRGNDAFDGPPIARFGIAVYDADAVYGINIDIGSFVEPNLYVSPNTRAGNMHFMQCYFDATKNSACVWVQGDGVKQQWSFTGCWIASAGRLPGGDVNGVGVRLLNAGAYQDINFTGCRVYNNAGSGYLLESDATDVNISGGTVYNNGMSGGSHRHGFKWLPASAANVGPSLSGVRFAGNESKDVYIGANANSKGSIQACNFEAGIEQIGVMGKITGLDVASSIYASATTLTISPCHDYIQVTGTTNVAGIAATYRGHMLTIKFEGELTVIDNSQNLRLSGHFSTVANSTLTLRCDGAEWLEVGRTQV